MSLEYEFTLIGVSENWLHDSICDLYNLPGYNFIENHRSHRSGGGVVIYLNKNIEFSIRYDLSEFDNLLESVFIEIQIDTVQCIKDVIIGIIYRPPGTDLCEFNVMIGELLENIKAEDKFCYLMGYYNINFLNYESHDQTATFIDMLYSYTFVPLINRPTRVTSSSATLIDNIFTNNHDALVKSYQGILVTDLSDHFPIFHINDSFTLDVTYVFIVKRSFSPQNKQSFLNDLAIADWNYIHSSEDTQVAFGQFHQMLLRAFNKNFPKRKVKIKYYNRKPWLSDGLKNSIRHKIHLCHKSIIFRTAYNETTYKTYRNKLKNVLAKAEKDHFAKLLEANKSNMKKTWMILKDIINNNRQSRVQSQFKISDGSTISNKQMISEKFNDFFINIGLADKITKQDKSPAFYLGNKLENSFFIEPVLAPELDDILKTLRKCAPRLWWN